MRKLSESEIQNISGGILPWCCFYSAGMAALGTITLLGSAAYAGVQQFYADIWQPPSCPTTDEAYQQGYEQGYQDANGREAE